MYYFRPTHPSIFRFHYFVNYFIFYFYFYFYLFILFVIIILYYIVLYYIILYYIILYIYILFLLLFFIFLFLLSPLSSLFSSSTYPHLPPMLSHVQKPPSLLFRLFPFFIAFFSPSISQDWPALPQLVFPPLFPSIPSR